MGTGLNFTLTQSEVGKIITLTASYTDLQGGAESVSSIATAEVVNVNDAPSITSSTTATKAENASTSTPVYKLAATDPDANTTLSYSISGGADAASSTLTQRRAR